MIFEFKSIPDVISNSLHNPKKKKKLFGVKISCAFPKTICKKCGDLGHWEESCTPHNQSLVERFGILSDEAGKATTIRVKYKGDSYERIILPFSKKVKEGKNEDKENDSKEDNEENIVSEVKKEEITSEIKEKTDILILNFSSSLLNNSTEKERKIMIHLINERVEEEKNIGNISQTEDLKNTKMFKYFKKKEGDEEIAEIAFKCFLLKTLNKINPKPKLSKKMEYLKNKIEQLETKEGKITTKRKIQERQEEIQRCIEELERFDKRNPKLMSIGPIKQHNSI